MVVVELMPVALCQKQISFYSFLYVMHFEGFDKVCWLFSKGLSGAKRAKDNVEITSRRLRPSLLMKYLYLAGLLLLRLNVAGEPWVCRADVPSHCAENEYGQVRR